MAIAAGDLGGGHLGVTLDAGAGRGIDDTRLNVKHGRGTDRLHLLPVTNIERDQAQVSGVGQILCLDDTGGDESFSVYIDLADAVDLGCGARETLGELLRIKILRQVNEVTNPVE